ncbi:MAG: tetratricopeptide repeat protein [Corynebacterium sp.]|uniref:tetratricopeptide repeat protein n=1 Tax=Corynebacterium sp. TaxID=1720 RepID=UPI0026DCD0BC|nr:tetratricopeptide repeat protein [Corynebacterium sp.]MDO5028962.1 tetratricopeptide repeat protein [Corynebacterium sp.]
MAEHEGPRSGEGRGNRGNHGSNRSHGRGEGGYKGGNRGGRGHGGQGRGGQGGRGGRGGNRDSRGSRGFRRDDRDDRDFKRGDRGERGDRGQYGERGDRNDRNDRRGPGGQGGRGQGGRGRGGQGGRNFDRRGGKPRRSNRGGRFQDEKRTHRTGPQRPGFREERMEARKNEPPIPDDIRADELDPSVRQDLKSLAKDNADKVARHMIMAAVLLAEDPQRALQHARAAKDRAGRVGVVRETAGVTAYHAGEWKEALSELRAARRISGGPGMLAVMADCERGLGRPEKAIELARSEEAKQLDKESKIELAIVAAGARRDMGQIDEALVELETQDLNPDREDFEASRLFYAYADALVEAGRKDEAKVWFTRCAKIDVDELLDARERIEELS